MEIQEEAPSYLDDTADTEENEDSAVDAGTNAAADSHDLCHL